MIRKNTFLLLLAVFIIQSCSIFSLPQQKQRKVKGCLTHIVNVGEDLPSLLLRYEVLEGDLKEYNPNISHDLKPGDFIYIPKKRIGDASQSDLKRDIERIRAAREPKIDTPKPKEVEVEDDNTTTTKLVYKKHIVVYGETFYSISKLYDLTVAELQSHNETVSQNAISIGTTLNIPTFVKVSVPVSELVVDTESSFNDYKQIDFSDSNDGINISLILPLKDENGMQSANFTQFYQGFLVGLDSLRNEGINLALNVINSDKESIVADRIVRTGELRGSDIIIGPVYDEQFTKVAQYAAQSSIPIISPLAKVEYDSEFVFQVSPDDATKYDKLKELLLDKNVILLSTESDDTEFVAAMNGFCTEPMKVIPFNIKADPKIFLDRLSISRKNVFLVATTNPQQADGVISKIGAIRMFAGSSVVSTIATPRIARMANIDPSILYSADLSYVTSYHNDRTDKKIRDFDSSYMKLFGDAPSLFSYRGYDVALFFVGSLKEFGDDFSYYINNYSTTTLQVAYRFMQDSEGGKFVNKEWMHVRYTPSYDIIVK